MDIPPKLEEFDKGNRQNDCDYRNPQNPFQKIEHKRLLLSEEFSFLAIYFRSRSILMLPKCFDNMSQHVLDILQFKMLSLNMQNQTYNLITTFNSTT